MEGRAKAGALLGVREWERATRREGGGDEGVVGEDLEEGGVGHG